MPIEGFDYKAFAADLAEQAQEILNQEHSDFALDSLSEKDKKNIVVTVRNFSAMAGEALSNDAQLKFTADQASLVTQFIGEWTFNKSIDLICGKIPPEKHEPILQVIAANIFQTSKLALIKKMPNDALITLVEEKVQHVYEDELKKLLKEGEISDQQFLNAINISNLQDIMKKVQYKTQNQTNQNQEQDQDQEQDQTQNINKPANTKTFIIVIILTLFIYSYFKMAVLYWGSDRVIKNQITRELNSINNTLSKIDSRLSRINNKLSNPSSDTRKGEVNAD